MIFLLHLLLLWLHSSILLFFTVLPRLQTSHAFAQHAYHHLLLHLKQAAAEGISLLKQLVLTSTMHTSFCFLNPNGTCTELQSSFVYPFS